jgi:subtilisin family serine protease
MRRIVALGSVFLACCGGGGPSGGAASEASAPSSLLLFPTGTRQDRVLVKATNPLTLLSVVLSNHTSIVGRVTGTPWVLVAVPSGSTATSFVSKLLRDARVVCASVDMGLENPEGNGSTIPAGGLLLASAIATQADLERIGLPAAQQRATGAGVTVAVLDTGILDEHDGVEGHVASGGWDYVGGDSNPRDAGNGVDDDLDGYVDEDYAHGTFVASLVVAVAPDAEILPYRVLTAEGYGTSSDVASAIGAAVQAGADVINLSVSIPPGVQVVQEAIANARLLGVQVIASAGNTGLDDCNLPSAMVDALVVTAVDSDDVRADFASGGSAVDLAAPGVDILGAYPPDPYTAIWSGTSFSTAIVSGAYALVREQHPLWSPQDCVQRLLGTSVPLDEANPGGAGSLGAGRLDLDAATQ